MAWPTTKAGTTNVDSGSDRPSLARPDIKQNIDNVNSIIDEFNISSPSDGDVLQYSSSSGQWEQVASSALSGSGVAVLEVQSGEENVSSNVYRTELNEDFDPNGIVSLNGSYQFTLAAGTYFVEMIPFITDDDEAPYSLYNESDSSTEVTFDRDTIQTNVSNYHNGKVVLTLASTKNFSFRQDTAFPQDRDSTPSFKITT